ncbi:AAA family ATPase [Actinosynnema sp. NPDC020468]|uniref:ATP-binding protein n=1 Tax=Actinosynnema sp. NPDC020468 TaxID=3154488 RepID=UPI0033D5F3D6
MLVGRDAELVRLSDALTAAQALDGSLVVIGGPLGTGKSALVQSLRRIAATRGAHVLHAAASPLERRFPFGVVRQLCEPAIAGLSEEDRQAVFEGIADFLHPVFGLNGCELDTESLLPVKHALLHSVRHLLTVLGRDRPVVLLVDDLQWADDESLRCLGYLVHRLAGLRALVVVTTRDGVPDADRSIARGVTDGAGCVLRMGALSDVAVRALVRSGFGEEGGRAFLDACLAATGGNPRLVRSVVADLAESGVRPVDDNAHAVAASRPRSLRAWFLSRLRDQTPAAAAYLAAANVLGDADVDLVARLARLAPVDAAEIARSLVAQGFLLPGGTRFAHPSARAAVEVATAADEAERLHLAAAVALHHAGRPAEEIAAHVLAVPSRQERWMPDVMFEASSAALARGVHAEAARYLRRALLDVPTESTQRGRLLVELAAVESAVDPSAAVRHLLEALTVLRSAADRAAAVVRLSPTCLAGGRFEVAPVVRALAAELGEPEAVTGAERELRLRVQARLRYISDGDVRDLSDAVEHLRRVEHRDHLRTSGGRELLAVLLHAGALTGRVHRRELVSPALRLLRAESAESATLHTSLPIVIGVLVLADRTKELSSWLRAAEDEARRRRDPVARSVVEAGTALVLLARGMIGQAEAVLTTSVAAAGDWWYPAVTATGLGLACAAAQLPDLGWSERLVALCAKHVDHPVASALTQLSRGLRGAEAGQLPVALERVLDCGRQLERAGWSNPAVLPWRSLAAELQLRLGNAEAARALVDVELTAAQAWGSPVAIGRALRSIGVVTPGPEGVRSIRDALDVLAQSENRWESARATVELAQRLRETRPEEAAELAARGRSLTAACGVAPSPDPTSWTRSRGTPGGGVPELTPAESRVARLAAQGRTNQAIAEHLDVSSRAVEKHLTSVYRKLALSGRAELRDALESA